MYIFVVVDIVISPETFVQDIGLDFPILNRFFLKKQTMATVY